jgi:predicted DNA-binding transcriptional regulator YafY
MPATICGDFLFTVTMNVRIIPTQRRPEMPNKKSDELNFHLELLRLLPMGPPGITYEELHSELQSLGFDKTLRTIQRAPKLLIDLGVVCDTDEKVHRVYWPSDFRSIEKQLMPSAEAFSLRMIEQIVSPLLPESLKGALEGRFKKASARLEQLRRSSRRVDWADKIAAIPSHFTLRPPVIDPEVLRTVQEALLDDKELEVDYKSLKDAEPSRRTLYPRALVQSGSATYLIATVPDSKRDPDKPIQYRLDRIHKAIMSNRQVSSSKFNLQQYLTNEEDKVGSREFIRLELWVSSRLASILTATPLAEDQKLVENKDVAIVRATVRNTLRLQQWLLGHREHVEVRKPKALRDWMAVKLEAALDRYR